MRVYKYDIYDIIKKEYVATQIPAKEASVILGVMTKHVSEKADKDITCGGRYRVYRTFTEQELVEWKEEWDVVRLRTMRMIGKGRK